MRLWGGRQSKNRYGITCPRAIAKGTPHEAVETYAAPRDGGGGGRGLVPKAVAQPSCPGTCTGPDVVCSRFACIPSASGLAACHMAVSARSSAVCALKLVTTTTPLRRPPACMVGSISTCPGFSAPAVTVCRGACRRAPRRASGWPALMLARRLSACAGDGRVSRQVPGQCSSSSSGAAPTPYSSTVATCRGRGDGSCTACPPVVAALWPGSAGRYSVH